MLVHMVSVGDYLFQFVASTGILDQRQERTCSRWSLIGCIRVANECIEVFKMYHAPLLDSL